MDKVIIAMSGGVDSAVAALLLKQSGYSLTGVTMRLWNGEKAPDGIGCPPDENASEAKKTADALGFSHLTVGLGERFYKDVIEKFISEYKMGRTPNPCVECNKNLKFGALIDLADRLSIPLLSTGHYARIEKRSSGEYSLLKAADPQKDQSYFLWCIKKENLSRILFPLGSYTKPEIREIAAKHGLPCASRSDSQDVCFIPDGDYVSFIEKHSDRDASFERGSFVDSDGKLLGKHDGLIRYTIGQRKGLGIALGRPIFVGSKDIANNTVMLCSDRELYKDHLTASSLNLLIDDTLEKPLRVEAKIRYRHTAAPATAIRTGEDSLSLRFDEPQRAIAPGQSLVLYDGDRVIGGGIID